MIIIMEKDIHVRKDAKMCLLKMGQMLNAEHIVHEDRQH